MAIWRYYVNTAVADTLVVTGGGNLSTGATSISAGSGAPVGYPASFPWLLELEPGSSNFELVLVNSGLGTVASPWIITRGQDGSSAKTHNSGSALAHGFSAGDFNYAAQHYNSGSGSGVHGLPATAWLAGSFATLVETTPTAAVTTVSWSAISQAYKHLLIVCQARLLEAVASDDVTVQFNGDTGAHYSYITDFTQNSGGTLTEPAANVGSALASAPMFRLMAASSGSAATAGGGFAVIPNYTGTNLNKLFYAFSGGGIGTTSYMDMRSRVGVWSPAAQAAITAITLTTPSGGFAANGSFGLYGLG